MPSRSEVSRFSWTLIDQAVVSVGSFSVNIALARLLPQSDYGTFAAVLASLLLFQIVNMTVVLYPATIRIASAEVDDREGLVAGTLLFLALSTLALSGLTVVGMLVFGEGLLIPEVVGWFVAWQVQEALRRFLFAEFRYRAALVGDAVSYLGQAFGVGCLALAGVLTLADVFTVLGLTSLFGAAVQIAQVGLPRSLPRDLMRRARDHWELGSWSFAGSAVAALRMQVLLWLVGLTGGRADVAALQAVLNVVNIVNPVLVGVCNLVPQTAARASSSGWPSAWIATRPYALWGLVPTGAYAVCAFIAPELLLRLLYGAGSPYLGEGEAVRILAVALLFNYGGELMCSFLHGVGAPRTAWFMNLASLAVTLCAFASLYPLFGWMAAVFATVLGQAARLLLAYRVAKRVRAKVHPSAA